ncbi:MAG: hypothetical protein R3F61_01695 [Myxococcota bacterium]
MELEVDGVTVRLHPHRILEYDFGSVGAFDADRARVLLSTAEQAVREEGHTGTFRILVRFGSLSSLTRDARLEFANGDVNRRMAECSAIVATTPVAEALGSMFTGLNKPKRPVRVFSDAGEAVEWLRSFG